MIKDMISLFLQQNRDRTLFLGVLFIGLVLALTLGINLLVGARLNFAQANILRNRLRLVRTFSMQHQDYDTYRVAKEKEFGILQNYFVSKLISDEIVRDLNNFAVMHNVKLNNIFFADANEGKQEQGLRVYTVQINALGKCQMLLDFMKEVETADNLMLFDDVVLAADEGDDILLTGNIKILQK